MKKSLVFLTAVIAIILSTCIPAHAQIATFHRDASVSYSDLYAGMIVSFAGTCDSLINDTSRTFTFAGYQGESWYDNPIQYSKKLTKAASSDTPFVSLFFQGLVDSSNWVTIDTLVLKDSILTVQRGTIDFNNLKSKIYRMIIKGESNGANTPSGDFDFSLYLFLPRKDN